MPWSLLLLAGVFEVVWATAMARSEGFTRVGPTVLTVVALVISMALLAAALRDLPLGTAYAVWVGVGVVGTALMGMAWLGEPASPARLLFIGMILAGVIGLKLTAGPAPPDAAPL